MQFIHMMQMKITKKRFHRHEIPTSSRAHEGISMSSGGARGDATRCLRSVRRRLTTRA